MESDFTAATRQQMDDIILCYAALSWFRDFTQSSKFVDMNKAEVFLGFESGVHCFYPNLLHGSVNYEYRCTLEDWFAETYVG